jgi:hypothetical protein
MERFICKYCTQERKNLRSQVTHQARCHLNPNRSIPNIDYSKRKTSNAVIYAKQHNLPIPINSQKGKPGKKGHKHTDEFKKRLSEIAKKDGRGGVKASKRILYNGFTLGSTYPLTLAKSLDDNKIQWLVPDRLTYIDPNGISRTYKPDFYLPLYDIYLDPKNDFLINNPNPTYGFSDIEKIALVCSQNNVMVLILDKNELSWNAVLQKINQSKQ